MILTLETVGKLGEGSDLVAKAMKDAPNCEYLAFLNGGAWSIQRNWPNGCVGEAVLFRASTGKMQLTHFLTMVTAPIPHNW
jgi:hypothetical protein